MPQKERCGAKTKSGDPCRAWAMPNGRCRMHGGTNEGAPAGNKNAITTGEHESIYAASMTEQERAIMDGLSISVEEQLDEQLRLSAVRIRRMLTRIAELQGEAHTITERINEEGFRAEGPVDVEKERHEATLGQIQKIETALTRVASSHRRLLKLKHSVEQSKPAEDNADVSGYLDALNAAADQLDWSEEHAAIEEEQTDEA